MTVSYGANGASGSANAGYRKSESDSSSLAHHNSTISAGSLNSTSDTLTVAGANIEADTVVIETDTLDVRSLQDHSSGKSKTRGGNAGFGVSNGAVSSVSAGVEMADGSAERSWTDNQTRIIGRDSVTVNAKDTTLTGAVIANATADANGQLVDQGNLSLTTETLAVADLQDTDRSENRGINLGVTVNLSGEPRNEEQLTGPQTGQTTIGGHYYGHDRAQTTHATIGQGQIVVAGNEQNAVDGLNRDLGNSQEMTRDQEIGGLDASVTVDHRLLSSEGRQSIINDAVDTFEHGEDIAQAVSQVATEDSVSLLNFAGQVDKNAKATQIRNVLARQYPETLAILKNGEGDPRYQAAQAQVVQLAQAMFGLEVSDVAFYDGEATTGVLADQHTAFGSRDVFGAVITDPDHPGFGTVLLNTANTDKSGMMTTAGHEVIESKVLQGKEGLFFDDRFETKERVADLFGERLTARLEEATGGGLSQTSSGWSVAMRQTAETQQGTLLANTLQAGQVEYRQFRTNESRALDQARAVIEGNSVYSEAYKHEALANLDALACAEVRCGSGISKNDPLYETYREMEARGERLKQTQQTDIYAQLDQLGVTSTEEKTVGRGRRQHTREEPLFTYGVWDSSDDFIGSNEQLSARAQQVALGVGGSAEAALGVVVTTAGCGTVAGCAVGGPLGAWLAADGADTAYKSSEALSSPYVYLNGARVRDSFSETTNQEVVSPTLALLTNVGANVAGGVVAKRAGSLVLREELPVVSGASAVPSPSDISQRLDELKIEGHGPQRHSGLTEHQLVKRVFDGIDPATVSRVDLVHSPKLHKKPSEATTFISDDAFVRAEHSVRASQAFQEAIKLNPERPVVKISLQDALGNNGQNQVVGIRKVGPRENRQYEGLDFSNGSVQAFYRYNSQTRSYELETMFPTQYPVD